MLTDLAWLRRQPIRQPGPWVRLEAHNGRSKKMRDASMLLPGSRSMLAPRIEQNLVDHGRMRWRLTGVPRFGGEVLQ